MGIHEETLVKEHGEKFKELMENDRRIAERLGEMKVEIENIRGSGKSAHKRLDKIEGLIENIYELTSSVENLVRQNCKIIKVVEEHTNEIKSLQLQPGMIAIKAWRFIGIAAVTSTIGLILGIYLPRILGVTQ